MHMEQRMENIQHVDLERFLNDIKTVVRDGQELLKASVSGVKSKALEGARSTDSVVRQNPYRSLGLVFGLGVVVGVLAMGMMSSSGSEDHCD